MSDAVNFNSYANPASRGRVNSNEDASNASKKDGSQLEMDDFLNLLTAQLSNQDVMNPSSDTDFIAQMAQFTSLQAMQTLTEINYASYGASMIGKKVIVAEYNKTTGALEKDFGTITNVTLDGGTVSIKVKDKTYPMSGIMEVLDPTAPDPDLSEDENDKEDEGDIDNAHHGDKK